MAIHRRVKNKDTKEVIKSLNLISEKLDGLTARPSIIERVGTIFSNWSQVLMLFVVVFGYIYTVIPVLQKEQVSEQLAKLEMEKSKWDDKIKDVNEVLNIKKIETERLDNLREKLLSELNVIKKEKEKIETDYKSVSIAYVKAKQQIVNSQEVLKSAEQELYEQQKRQLLGKDPILHNYMVVLTKSYDSLGDYKFIFDFDEVEKTNEKLKETIYSPYESGENVLLKLKELINLSNGVDKKAKSRLYNSYKNGLEKHALSLVCPSPNYDAWEAAFKESEKLIEQNITNCIKMKFSKRSTRENWSSFDIKDLKNSDFWSKQSDIYAQECRISIKFNIKDTFTEEWNKITNPCRERVFKVNSIVLDETEVFKLENFGDISPPQLNLIEKNIIERLGLTDSINNIKQVSR
ncbi:hypothetical protein [Photobacterium leiognathi]|uniref:hypothetical protein n=1 Tax=Photobacterium leiognathi TaxID=553611 RepID=UPI00020889F3|nr:hypothetical protein [Photobacterium leiognathi]PSW55305.1 hypothetical protein CTM83_02870 [Photobacterium leiognathi subsp. mandapamensis]GAA06094.1 hypothetical protein PMSV_2242 [Photobacterium leiognathi subsp. mandapamensis svers.1.1.]